MLLWHYEYRRVRKPEAEWYHPPVPELSQALPQAFADSDFCHSDHSDARATKTAAKPVLTCNGFSIASLKPLLPKPILRLLTFRKCSDYREVELNLLQGTSIQLYDTQTQSPIGSNIYRDFCHWELVRIECAY